MMIEAIGQRYIISDRDRMKRPIYYTGSRFTLDYTYARYYNNIVSAEKALTRLTAGGSKK